ncbi:hypothetical protein ACSBR2_035096 [Camellia fascicularis]
MDLGYTGPRLTWSNNRKGWANTMGKQTPSLSKKLETLAHDASVWNKEIFGNIFRRKRWLLGRIEGIQNSQAQHYSHNLHNLEIDLVDQYNKVLYQEELLWFQKSRARWITQG